MLLNILLVVSIIAGIAGWQIRRKDSSKPLFLVVVPLSAVIVILLYQVVSHQGTSSGAQQKKQALKAHVEEMRFYYAVGWRLASEAAQRNPSVPTQNVGVLAIAQELAKKEPASDQGQWLAGIQDAAKKSGLKITPVFLDYNSDMIKSSGRVPIAQEIKAEVLSRLQQEHPQSTVWLSYYLPQTSALANLSFLPEPVKLYCFAQFVNDHNVRASWWANQIKSGKLQAVVLERYAYTGGRAARGKPTQDLEANFKASFVLLTPDAPELPPDLVAQLP